MGGIDKGFGPEHKPLLEAEVVYCSHYLRQI